LREAPSRARAPAGVSGPVAAGEPRCRRFCQELPLR
jgi:hypothetical protein